MTFIDTVPEDGANGHVAEMYSKVRESIGYVPNYAKAFSHRPALFEAWAQLNSTVKSAMDPRRYELATVAAAVRRRSSYCALAHSEKLLQLGSTDEEVRSLARDPEGAPLGELEQAIVGYATQVAEAPHTVTAADIDRLRALGLSDSEIFDIASAAAARLFFTALCDAVGTQPDAVYRETMSNLVDDLAVGRPVDGPAGSSG
ncbi:MAG TPA: peroxidase-related enzyme [Acidimicrobiia bacterium]